MLTFTRRFVTAAQPASLADFENSLFGPFTAILQNDVAEFVPFVFQILAQMLEQHSGKDLPQSYTGLLPPLLMPPMWESKGNVPALVRLFQSFLARGADAIVAANQIDSIMAIYQRLITSRLNDTYGFELLQAAFEHVQEPVLARYKKPVLTLMLTRLQSSKTDKFSKGFVNFIGTLGCLQKADYPDAVVKGFDEVQPGLFPQILQGVVVPEVAKMPPYQRRTTFVGLARLATESPSMAQAPNNAALPALLSVLLPAIMTPSEAVDRAADEEEALGAFDVEEQGFQASFSQLAASVSARKDPAAFAGADLKQYLAKQLSDASRRHPGVYGPAIEAASTKSEAAKAAVSHLQAELQKGGLQLA